MPKLPAVTDKDVVRALTNLGFFEQRQKGSHLVMKHKDGRRSIIAMHNGKIIPNGTLLAILRDAKISKEEFIEAMR
jgi:predicted RNA binding protein YcfA (HicA-like mRNA interferase family)